MAGRAQFAESFVPGLVGVAAGQVGECAAGSEEPDVGAVADGEVAEGLGDMAFPHADRAVQDHGLAGVQPAEGGEVADLGSGELGRCGEIEAFEGDLLIEPGGAEPAVDGHAGAAGDLVFAQDLEEVDVAEFPGSGLGQPGLDGLQHAGQLEGAQCRVQGTGLDRGGHGVAVPGVVAVSCKVAGGCVVRGVMTPPGCRERPAGAGSRFPRPGRARRRTARPGRAGMPPRRRRRPG